MRMVWRYEIHAKKLQAFDMPRGAKVLAVQVKDGTPCLWAEVEAEALKENRAFEVFPTGKAMPEDMGVERKYVGTFQANEGGETLVFHVYERIN